MGNDLADSKTIACEVGTITHPLNVEENIRTKTTFRVGSTGTRKEN